MVTLTNGQDVIQIEEQLRVAVMLLLVVRDGGLRMMPIAFDDDALTFLTGVEIAEEGLPADAMLAAPARVFVEMSIGGGFGAATVDGSFARHVSCALQGSGTMILFAWRRFLRNADQPASFYDEWLSNAQRFHELVFVTIESNIFMAALWAGAIKTGSWVLFGIYGFAYAAFFIFFTCYCRYVMHAAAERFDITGTGRLVFLSISIVVSAFIALALPYAISRVTTDILAAQTF